MSNVKVYQYCDDGLLTNFSITGTPKNCLFAYSYVQGDSTYSFWNGGIDLVSSIPAPEDIYIRIYNLYQSTEDGVVFSENDAYFTVLLPSGSTTLEYNHRCAYERHINATGKEYGDQRVNWAVADQTPVPECGTQPSGCTLTYVSHEVNPPSQRGYSDGSISLIISGATGITSDVEYRINGVVDTLSGSTTYNVYTGLSQGTYDLYVNEGECWIQITDVIVPDGEFRTGDFIVNSSTDTMVAIENPIIVNLSTAVSPGDPEYSQSTITLVEPITGTTITFDLTYPQEYSATFISKGYPDRSTYWLNSILKDEIGNQVGTNTINEITTSLLEVLQGDSLIPRLYYISAIDNIITFTAKEYNDKLDLTSNNVTISGTGVTLNVVQNGHTQFDGQLSSNYSLYTELFVNQDLQYGETPDLTVYKKINELELPYNSSNVHMFDMSDTLKNFVSSPIYDISFSSFIIISPMIGSYYVKYGEKYPLVENSNTKKKRYKGQIDPGYFINSSLDFKNPNDMSVYQGETFTDISGHTNAIDTVKFLNTAPITKYSQRDSREYLYLLIPKDYPYVTTLYMYIYYYDGTTDFTILTYNLTDTINYGGVMDLNVSYGSLGLSTYESTGKKIRKIEFQVKQQIDYYNNLPYSTVGTINYELDEQPSRFHVIFLNLLGTYETYTFVGEVVSNQTINRSTYQRPYNVSLLGQAEEGFQYNSVYDVQSTDTFVVNTGIITSDVFEYVKGILKSTRVYTYDSSLNLTFLTVIDQVATKSTNDNEYTLQITFKKTISDNLVQS